MKKSDVRPILWSNNFAYCVGIISADGNLSKDGRHIKIVSKDPQIITNCRTTLKPTAKITMQSRGAGLIKKYYVLSFSSVTLFRFLTLLGIFPAKSRTIAFVNVPKQYFQDFVRGLFDGDGSISIYANKQSSKDQVKLRFASASISFLNWIKDMLQKSVSTAGGYITLDKRCYSLSYGKVDAFKIINFMYYEGVEMFLDRKHETCIRASGGIGIRTGLRSMRRKA